MKTSLFIFILLFYWGGCQKSKNNSTESINVDMVEPGGKHISIEDAFVDMEGALKL